MGLPHYSTVCVKLVASFSKPVVLSLWPTDRIQTTQPCRLAYGASRGSGNGGKGAVVALTAPRAVAIITAAAPRPQTAWPQAPQHWIRPVPLTQPVGPQRLSTTDPYSPTT